jgi:site-specific DNA recombinase
LLKGIIFGPTGVAMSPSHTRKSGRLYRYYISQAILKEAAADCPVGRVPAAEIEKIVIDQVRTLLRSPEVIVQTWRRARKTSKTLAETDVRSALFEFDQLWNELFPAEQARIIQVLVERVDVGTDGVDIGLRVDGITSLVGELVGKDIAQRNAA